MRPSPGPVLALPNLGAGMLYFVPRLRYVKFFFKCTCILSGLVLSADVVTEARSKVGLPQDGQNFLVLSLHILRKD